VLRITDLVREDIDDLATGFADWPKERSTFEKYADEADAGRRDVLVARVDGELAGYVTVYWRPSYPAYAAAGIPEVRDFNVLPAFQRRGVGTALMDAAETRVAEAGHRAVGIGVGLYGGDGYGYGSAQRMYVKRGYVPDGAGVVIDGVRVEPGTNVYLDDSPILMFTKDLSSLVEPRERQRAGVETSEFGGLDRGSPGSTSDPPSRR
jgi:GNAT superfamily N-acetyltransferase